MEGSIGALVTFGPFAVVRRESMEEAWRKAQIYDERKQELDERKDELREIDKLRNELQVGIDNRRRELDIEIEHHRRQMESREYYVGKREKETEKRLARERKELDRIAEQKSKGFPWLANAFADYFHLEEMREARRLETKYHPAKKAAEKVKEMSAARRATERQLRVAKYVLSYYESLFPFLVDFRGEDVDDLVVRMLAREEPAEDAELDDTARVWLTDAEYSGLSNEEKYQLALDRYRKKRKSPWEIGRDYERYIGYKYESAGFGVHYQGIIEGFEDLGRDLIATKDGTAEVIQCKYWSEHKTIHEKHIFQLFGTVTAYRVDHPKENVSGTFVTSTRLSDRAKQFADILEIAVQEAVRLKEYPCVKCNVSRRADEKIYHLPFDQQYDRTIVEKERLERYVSTVAEAEALGFRRAKRWLGGDEEQAREPSASRRRRKPLRN